MAILSEDALMKAAEKQASRRACNVSSRLTKTETESLDSLAKERGLQRGDCIRQILLAELSRGAGVTPTPELTEIVGLRLLLTTLLKPLAIGQQMTEQTFEAVIAQVKKAKTQMAAELLPPQGGKK